MLSRSCFWKPLKFYIFTYIYKIVFFLYLLSSFFRKPVGSNFKRKALQFEDFLDYPELLQCFNWWRSIAKFIRMNLKKTFFVGLRRKTCTTKCGEISWRWVLWWNICWQIAKGLVLVQELQNGTLWKGRMDLLFIFIGSVF